MLEQIQSVMTNVTTMHLMVIGIGVGVGMLAFYVARGMLRTGVGEGGPAAKAAAVESLALHSSRDRRAAARRHGNPVDVELLDPKGQIQPLSGWVIDRSRGGVAFLVDEEVPVGAVFNARPRVNNNSYSVPVEVRSCRRGRDGFTLGCQFLQMPPWNVLMLFG